MALRLARDFTSKPRILRFRTHFHGWHDHMTHGVASQFDGSAAPGVLTGVAENVLLADPDDVAGLRALLDAHADIRSEERRVGKEWSSKVRPRGAPAT